MTALLVSRGVRKIWLGQSARTTVVTRRFPALESAHWMASLGDAIHRPRMLETVFGSQLKSRLAITGPLMLDSGGFTMMMRNGSISIHEVAKAFGATGADVVVSLDYPPLSTDSPEDRAGKYSRTIQNYATLLEQVKGPSLAPVVHGVTLDELHENCLAVRAIGGNPTWVCLGGLVPLLRQCGQLGQRAPDARAELKARISFVRESFPHSNLHVLGVGSPRTISAAFLSGADSVDSIGWRRSAGFGAIFMPGGSERFVADRDRKRPKSRLTLSDADRDMLAVCGCPACLEANDLEIRQRNLAESYLFRAAHNAWVLLGEVSQSAVANAA